MNLVDKLRKLSASPCNDKVMELTNIPCKEMQACDACIERMFNFIADEIERCYIPRPRFEDGTPVKRGDETAWGIVDGICIYSDGAWTLDDSSGTDIWGGTVDEFVKRPTPNVYDADGVEMKAGDMGFDVTDGCPLEAVGINGDDEYCLQVRYPNSNQTFHIMPERFAHKQPVFDAEGVRICKGDTVWTLHTGDKFTVDGFTDDGAVIVRFGEDSDDLTTYAPHGLIRHEPDSLESIAKYAKDEAVKYAGCIEPLNNVADRITAFIERGA